MAFTSKIMSKTKTTNPQRCEGYRRYGGAFTFGPVRWERCKKAAIVMLRVKRDGKEESLPACITCWNEAIENKLKIIEAHPIA